MLAELRQVLLQQPAALLHNAVRRAQPSRQPRRRFRQPQRRRRAGWSTIAERNLLSCSSDAFTEATTSAVASMIAIGRRVQVIRDLCVIASADGRVTEREMEVLYDIAAAAEVPSHLVTCSVPSVG